MVTIRAAALCGDNKWMITIPPRLGRRLDRVSAPDAGATHGEARHVAYPGQMILSYLNQNM